MSQIKDIWLYTHHMLRSSRQIINDNLRPLNLTSAEGNILIHLLTLGEEMGQEQLVEQLDISKPAVSRALNSLQKKGYVTSTYPLALVADCLRSNSTVAPPQF